jgi:type IV pilus assembly protein PilM
MGVPFIKSHARRRDSVLAIDLGGRSTKGVLVQRRGEQYALAGYTVLDSPVFDKSPAPEVLAEHLKEVARALGNRTKQLTIALGVGDTVFRQVEAPFVPVPDLRLMFKFNSKTYLQQELADHVFDCQFGTLRAAESGKPANQQKQKVMVGAARKQLIDDVQSAAKMAGLVAEQVVPAAVGPINSFELAEPEAFKKEVVALVELGFKSSVVTILDCGDIMLNRVVAIGGDRLTQGLAESLGCSYQEAEGIKIGMPGEVTQNLETLVHPLGRELRASIDFFENHHDKAVAKVFLSGATARSEPIFQTLQAELMVACEVWSPVKTLQLELPTSEGNFEEVAPTLTVAIGAAAASF